MHLERWFLKFLLQKNRFFPLFFGFFFLLNNVGFSSENRIEISGNIAKKNVFIENNFCSDYKLCFIANSILNIIASDLNQTAMLKSVIDLEYKAKENNLFLNQNNFNQLENFHKNVTLATMNIRYFLSIAIDVNHENKYKIYYSLHDIITNTPILNGFFDFEVPEIRYISHLISNSIVQKISGYNPYFESKIMYIAQDGNDSRNIGIFDRDTFGGREINTKTAYVPIFSKDSNKIYFLDMSSGQPILKSMDFGSWKIHNAIKNFGRIISPKIIPNKPVISFISLEEDNKMSIYEFNLMNKNLTKLMSYDNIILSANFHPNGNEIFYHDVKNGKKQIYKTDIKKTLFWHSKTQISQKEGSYSEPSISPDGTMIVFTKYLQGLYNICIMDIDGSNERILFTSYRAERPSWNKNSMEIIFSFKESKREKSKLKIIDIIGNEILTIKRENIDLLEPHWFLLN